MRHATANGKRIVSVMTGLAQKSGDSATLTERNFCKKKRLRLGFFLGGLGLISILLLSVKFPADASRSTSVELRDTEKNRPDSSLFETPGLRTSTDSDEAMRPRLREAFGNVPLSFEANRGQTDSRVKFLSRGGGYELFLTSREAVMLLKNGGRGSEDRGQESPKGNSPTPARGSQLPTSSVLRMQFVGANPRPEIVGEGELPGKVNYFIGNDPAKWRTGISTYSSVRYQGIYQGIDLVYYGNQRQLEYDFVVEPGANPKDIELQIAGADDSRVDAATGDLMLRVAGKEVRQLKPVAYQIADGERREVAASYVVEGKREIRFDIRSYDATKPLVIDPILIYSTYLGGTGQGEGYGLAVDSAGSAYVVGYTSATNFPTVNAFQSTRRGTFDVTVTKFNPTGSALVYSTYLGGTGDQNIGYAIDVDGAGNAFITGRTFTANFPVTASAYQSTYIAGTAGMAFVSRFDASGGLAYSTYFGNSQGTRGHSIATDGAGNAYVTGQATGSAAFPFPVTPSAFLQNGSGFLSKINTNASGASSLVYSTMLSSGNSTNGRAIAADAAGNVYIAGNTGDANFATPGAAQTTLKGAQDAFVAKFNTNLSGNASRIYATYLGGTSSDQAGQSNNAAPSKAIAIDADGNAYITGLTASTDFPVLNAYQSTKGGIATKQNAFLTKLNATGSAFIYSTYLGGSVGSSPDGGNGVAVNVVGNAYVTGVVSSSDFPTQSPLPASVGGTNGGIFLAKFTPSGGLVYSTRLGCLTNGNGDGVALDGAGNAFLTGATGNCTTFPTVNPLPGQSSGFNSAFVSLIPDPTIIGRVVDENNSGIPGATVNLSGVPSGTTTTDANGYYTFGLLTVGSNYTVSVSVPNYIFNSQTVNNLQKNVRLDFSPVVVTISGQVTLGGGGLDATTMTLSGGKSLTTQTSASGNYSFPNLPAGRNYTVTPSKPSFGFVPTSSSFTNVLVNQTANFIAQATVQFNVGSYVANEADGKATVTITRSSGASGPASVRYSMSDGTAKQKSDYILAFGTLRMAAGETSKSFQVLIVDDVYVEGDETLFVTLSDPVGATIGTPNPAQITITDNDTVPPTSNPIDQSRFFVQEHYYDFLSRYPDPSGWDFWTNNINNCTPKPSCTGLRLIDTSAAYFLSIEFQQTGYLVERIHKSAFGDATGTSTLGGAHQLAVPTVRFPDFISDTEEIGDGLVVGQSGWETVLENNKQAFTSDFVQRTRFTTAFPTTMTPTQFVDRLNTNAGNVLSASDRANAIALFGSATDTTNVTARAQALRQVAENQNLATAEFNRAFVLMQFFGYLRRNPNDLPDSDYTGYEFWLNKLNQFNGNYNAAEMVKAFIVSIEYRQRFGPATPPPTATPTPTPTPGQGLTPEQRVAALESVRAKFESLSNSGLSKDDANQQVLNFILSRPEFAEAGISTDSCVWAKYTDGVELIVINNLDPPARLAAASKPAVASGPHAQPENLPDSTNARLLWALGPAFTDNPIPDLRVWLNDENYTQPLNEGAAADVASLKAVGGDGVLFLGAHGGLKNRKFTVTTAELESLDLEKENSSGTGSYDDDLKTGRLVYATALWGYSQDGKEIEETTYGITADFIRKYWHDFAPNSFVFIDACSSVSPEASDFRNAIKEKGASVYAGWTAPSGLGFPAARFVFDRLLGANKVYPESDGFKQRPFDYASVAQDLTLHGLGTDLKYGGQFQFIPLGNGDFQTLAPSIREMQVSSFSNTLVIFGIFGDDPGAASRAVFVGGQACPVSENEWNPDTIVCNLPKSGAGSAGEVIVTVRQQKSNTAYLSQWQGTFTHTVKREGTLKYTATYHVTFQADIRKVRYEIHKPPTFSPSGFDVPRVVTATEDSTLGYECSGTYTVGDSTETWSGSGTVPRVILNPLRLGFLVAGGLKSTTDLWLFFSSGSKGRMVTITNDKGSNTTNESLFDVVVAPSDGDSNVNFSLDSNGNIVGNSLTYKNGDGTIKLVWSDIQIQYPPSPASPR